MSLKYAVFFSDGFPYIILGQSVTFGWESGHNVNVGLTQDQFEKCEGLSDKVEKPGNIIVSDLDVGHHYFACGVGGGYHCKHGVKAHIQVVSDKSECIFSSH